MLYDLIFVVLTGKIDIQFKWKINNIYDRLGLLLYVFYRNNTKPSKRGVQFYIQIRYSCVFYYMMNSRIDKNITFPMLKLFKMQN